MTLSVPKYIHEVNIQNLTIRYTWDDRNVEAVEKPVDEELISRLNKITLRGNAAFTIAVSEWIVYRFKHLLKDQVPLEFLEAAWAQTIDSRYGYEWDPLQAGWEGPIMGPIREALMWSSDAIEKKDEYLNPSSNVEKVLKLTRHVLCDTSSFQVWFDTVINRLETYYPMNPDEKLGDVVPRELFCPDLDFKCDQSESLINKFLRGLDYDSNPFLRPPKEMLEEGFDGTPYVFDIEKDRKERFEW